MQFRFFKLLYTELKEIVHLHHDPKYRGRHKLEVFLLILMIVRFSFVPFTRLKFSEWCPVWRYDPLSVAMFYEYNKLYYYIFVIFVMIFLLGLSATIIFHLITPVDTCTMLYPYDLIVVNFDQFRHCILSDEEQKIIWQTRYDHNIQCFIDRFYLPRMVIEFSCRILTDIQYRLYFDHINQSKLSVEFRMIYFPDTNFRARRCLMILQILLNISYFAMHVISVPIIGLLFVEYYQCLAKHSNMNLWYKKIWFAVEYIILNDVFYTSVQCGLFGAGLELLIGANHYFQIKKWNSSLKSIRAEMKAINISQRRRCQINCQLSMIHRDHGRISKIYRKAFSEAWSPILLIFIMVSIPLNIAIILLLRSGVLNTFEYIPVSIGIVVHTVIIMVLIVPMCFEVETLHQTKKDISGIVPNIKQIRLKLKYDDWYGRLLHGPKFGPVISTYGSLTYRMALELLGMYIAFWLFALTRLNI